MTWTPEESLISESAFLRLGRHSGQHDRARHDGKEWQIIVVRDIGHLGIVAIQLPQNEKNGGVLHSPDRRDLRLPC